MDYGNTTTKSDHVYFAAKPAEECSRIVLDKADSFFNVLRSNAFLDKLLTMYRAYYGLYSSGYAGTGHQIVFTGDQGELASIPVNHFSNLAHHMLTMITSNRPIMECKAINTDYKSYAQTILGNGILDYYMRIKDIEGTILSATELAIVMGAGYVKLSWNSTAGEIYDNDPKTGEPIREGELESIALDPLSVVMDGTKERWDNDWLCVRTFKNKYDLAAKYPDLSDKILQTPSKTDRSVYRLALFSNDSTDDVCVYEFFHRQTESMPDGRYMLFLNSDCILLDAPMPYRIIPIFRITPGAILGTPYGYSPMFDIFPIQEAINQGYSTILTNQTAFGVQSIWMQPDAEITTNNLEGGMNIIKSQVKPEAINLTQTPAEVFKFLEELISAAETISGVNSVARGNPESKDMSGTALALIQSQALQFMNGLQQSYVKLIENVGNGIITILKDFSTTPKIISMVGKNNRPLLKEFTGDKISEVNRVIVDMGNALSRSTAGRVQMAQDLLQMKQITNAHQYFQVINTGRIDSMFEGDMDELMNIKKENEELIDGINPLVSPLDKHSMHINEHRSVLSDPDLRNDPNLLQVVMDHIEQHVHALENTDPRLLQLIGEQPLTPLQPPMPPSGGPQGPPQGNSPQQGGSNPAQVMTPPQQPAGQLGRVPEPAKVSSQMLQNPQLQEQAMGNVKQ